MVSETTTFSEANDNQRDDDSLVTEELTKAITDSIQPIMVKWYRTGQTYLAIGSKHGGRLMLQINAHAAEIPTLLRGRSVTHHSNDPSSGKNRPINDEHVKRIKNYIIERAESKNKWILGAITANVDPSKIQYQKIWGDLYVMVILHNTSLEITDGQHRRRAIVELIESDGIQRDLIKDCTFPINLVLEGEFEQCQTDFCDMAQTLAIPQSLLVAYSGFGKDAIARIVVENVNMFYEKTQKIKSTPGSKTGYIYTINYVAKLVSCAFTGSPNDKLSEVNKQDLVKQYGQELSNCLNSFFLFYSQTAEFPNKSREWQKTARLTGEIIGKDQLYWKDAAKFRESCILGISVGLEILGSLLHYIRQYNENDGFDEEMVKQIAQDIDWSKQGPCWKDTVIVPDGKGGTKISAGRGSAKTAFQNCLKQLDWE
ncbi:DNA sulfur modification protein DndB [Roseofilum sp. BLCC_M154]|uniref:DNA sulfur modification protein DndB n=1 Tax=Roseofilum acuticapitatum BLCC-M154 TaxID=3022444 RepID=A0ABT7AYV4_9CYAN|nr:DNA sulfur modification protein DndB [Roseofilum acuticapitatum]MDJ1172092.1 DNA sulfur modification protein DndB [Roseofilum acuticapitatum BLCC-M154]